MFYIYAAKVKSTKETELINLYYCFFILVLHHVIVTEMVDKLFLLLFSSSPSVSTVVRQPKSQRRRLNS